MPYIHPTTWHATQSAVVSSGRVARITLRFANSWNLFSFPLYIAKFSEKRRRMSSLKCAKWNKARGEEVGAGQAGAGTVRRGWLVRAQISKVQDSETRSIRRAAPLDDDYGKIVGEKKRRQWCRCVVWVFFFFFFVQQKNWLLNLRVS